MAAMLPTGGSAANPYAHYDNPSVEDEIIDPDDATLEDLDDPISTSDRAPLTGNISSAQAHSNVRTANSAQGYLNSVVGGEDRRATLSTIDESVWETLKRDLLAIGEKMRQVLWPRYLLGGFLTQRGGGIAEADRTEEGAGGAGVSLDSLRNLVGRWPDADVVLQGGMSEGLRNWDLWGPLLFCLLLSLFLSISAKVSDKDDQRSIVFSGVFATVWIGEAVVTLQIKLLGGNISFFQSICIIGYTLFPLVIASLLSAIGIPMVARIPVYIVLGLWSMAAGISILGGSGVVKNRVVLAVYPLLVFYIGLTCLCFIS